MTTSYNLDERTVNPDPIRQFQQWLRDAGQAAIVLPEAMAVATVSRTGQPSVRMVLLKEVDEKGFVFFTNYDSRKGKEISENPRVELLFWWSAIERQVRIEGSIEKVTAQESDEYFRTRPRESQISAYASPQSAVISSREELNNMVRKIEQQYHNNEIPRPKNWGGLRVRPFRIEFWEGKRARLHDRILYTRTPEGIWKISRLAP